MMNTTDHTSIAVGKRILQGIAITSALLIGAGYVWRAQDKAKASATYQIDREILTESAPAISSEGAVSRPTSTPIASGVPTQKDWSGMVDFENPVHSPEVLISGSKSLQIVPVGQILDSAAVKEKLVSDQARGPMYTPDVLISGSKAETVINSVINLPETEATKDQDKK